METALSEFTYGEHFTVNDEVKRAFDRHGYVIIRQLLDGEEVQKLRTAVEHKDGVMKHTYGRDDAEGGRTKVVLWNHPGSDITGVMAKSQKLAGTFEKLLGGEVYHYHSKIIMKEAHTGGAHVWHQDYGYWYENGCMFPDMGTVWIAIDKADESNGCLKILSGSHRLGRVDHVPVGEQVGADLERVSQAQAFCPLVHVKVEPGDALFFHCNILHRSDQNKSDRRRWAFLVGYNRADNNPVYKHHHPQYTPLEQVPNSAIKECNVFTDMTGKDFFLGPKHDFSVDKVQHKNQGKA